MFFFLENLLKYIIIIIPILLSLIFLILIERKVIASLQKRKGPNVVGIYGLSQSLADALKLLFKETIIPFHSNIFIFIISPIIGFGLSLLTWIVIPFDFEIVFLDLNLGIIYILAISSLSVYSLIMSGWSSNSKYAFLGALRSAAQLISYEVSFGLIISCVIYLTNSLNISLIVLTQKNVWYWLPLFPLFILFFISVLAETNRTPFDLPEAEAELVAGYNVEYSSMSFALFFMAEYINMLLMSFLISILFFGGWYSFFNFYIFKIFPFGFWLGIKVVFFFFLFVWVRGTYPRFRYDQLMQLGWKILLPISLGLVWFYAGLTILLDISIFLNWNILYLY